MKFKKVHIQEYDNLFIYTVGLNTVVCSTLWSACRSAVRSCRPWIMKQRTKHLDCGVKLILPDGRKRLGFIRYAGIATKRERIVLN